MKRIDVYFNEEQFSALQKMRKQKQFPSVGALAKYYFLKEIEKELKNTRSRKRKNE